MFLGHPVKTPILSQFYDGGTVDTLGFGNQPWGLGPGPHMICDKNGTGLFWDDLKTNMTVKIRAKPYTTNHDGGWEWLYASVKGKSFKIIIKIDFKQIFRSFTIRSLFLTYFILGWTYYDKLRSLPDDKIIDVLKQEWIVEKNGPGIRFISAYKLNDYPNEKHGLIGGKKYSKDGEFCCKTGCQSTCGDDDCKNSKYYWASVEKDPDTWRMIPENFVEPCVSS